MRHKIFQKIKKNWFFSKSFLGNLRAWSFNFEGNSNDYLSRENPSTIHTIQYEEPFNQEITVQAHNRSFCIPVIV